MRKEYDISGGERGRFYGNVTGTRVIRAAGAKARSSKAAKGEDDFDEAISLLSRVRPHMQDAQHAEKLKERIEEFLDRVVT